MLNNRKIVSIYPVRKSVCFAHERESITFSYHNSFANITWSMLINPRVVEISAERSPVLFSPKRVVPGFPYNSTKKDIDWNNNRKAIFFGLPFPYDNILFVVDHKNKFIKDHLGDYITCVELKSYVAYGRLYTHQVTQKQLLPAPWCVPTDSDYKALRDFMNANFSPPPPYVYPDSLYFMHQRMKPHNEEIHHPRWDTLTMGQGDNRVKFNGLPGGNRNYLGDFVELGAAGYWWCSDILERDKGKVRSLSTVSNSFHAATKWGNEGLSIRCCREATQKELILPEGTYCDVVRDFDGNMYQTVKINNKIWMAQNFASSHYIDGEPIPNITDNTQWSSLNMNQEAFCDYNNDPALSFFDAYENIIY